MSTKNIKHVAIYLRKSRGDVEKDILAKHRSRLIEFAKKSTWTYKIYEEDVLSGERLSTRPQVQELLIDIESGIYDGVLVIHYDRLSRGGTKDFGEIIEVFQFSDTYIITPERTYDVNDINDLTMLGIQGVFSNTELKRIVDRLVQGKKDGVRQGKLTNGKPPYPYQYAKEVIISNAGKDIVTGKVVVNEEKAQIYSMIKNMYLAGDKGTEQIAVYLNTKGIPSPNGSTWHNNAVKRLLVDEFHMGKVIYGRNEWKKGRDNRKRITQHRDESEWVVGEGEHEKLKTPEEHKRIREILARNNKIPRKSRAGCFPTSGIMYCKQCGHRMSYSIGKHEAKSGKTYNFTKCSYKDPFGVKCSQKGIKMTDEFYSAIYNAIITRYLDKEHLEQIDGNKELNSQRKELLKYKQSELSKADKMLKKVMDAYENDAYTLEQFQERKKPLDESINSLKKEIAELQREDEYKSKYSTSQMKRKIEWFKREWAKVSRPKDQNVLLKSIVKKIYYDRNGDIVTLDIEYN
jgi:DNA invertase Pin-like site-specific DNA recombinase